MTGKRSPEKKHSAAAGSKIDRPAEASVEAIARYAEVFVNFSEGIANFTEASAKTTRAFANIVKDFAATVEARNHAAGFAAAAERFVVLLRALIERSKAFQAS